MGMRAYYVQLDSEDMDQVLKNRQAAGEMLMSGSMGGINPQDMFRQLGIKDADLRKMEKMLGPIPAFMKGASTSATKQKNRPTLQIEKSWQAIHFILCGDPWKGNGLLHNVVLGGTEVGENLGYGNPRYLDPFRVVQTSTALDRLGDDEFNKKARAANFSGKDIYVYGDRLSGEDYAELLEYFQEIRAFFKGASDKGCGILLGII
ncbi:MAG: YfbM family protein [Candidatus Obscuribacterales bacterium]|nr:YfbM family protein [Candidatus Obscuribacterales bacterium]